jgi:hypothetical protein
MQETWTIQLDRATDPSELIDILPELILKQRMELGIFLSYYYRKQGAVAEDVKLEGKLLESSPGKGSFILDYKVVHFNACLNIHDEARQKMQIEYEYDFDKLKVLLKGAYWPEREMDEI